MSINKENKSVKKYQNNDEIKQTMVKRINIVMKMKYDWEKNNMKMKYDWKINKRKWSMIKKYILKPKFTKCKTLLDF